MFGLHEMILDRSSWDICLHAYGRGRHKRAAVIDFDKERHDHRWTGRVVFAVSRTIYAI